MFDEILAEEYPKQITLKNSAEVTIRLLSSGDTDALYQFFQSISSSVENQLKTIFNLVLKTTLKI